MANAPIIAPISAALVLDWEKKARVTGDILPMARRKKPRSIAAQASIIRPSTLNTTPACANRTSRRLMAAAPAGPSQPTNAP